jgi:hypothetical protein|tara:strand:- start:3 stop:290 length:288 start_codon:yes stop_codon:yes gene_type:complete
MSKILEPITSLEQELELRIEWLENGLKEIANGRDDMNGIYIKQQAQSILDGEATTADEHNVVRISDVNKEIAKEWNRDREEKINMIQSIGYRGEE